MTQSHLREAVEIDLVISMTTSQSWIVYEGNIPVDMMIECLNDKMIELTFGLTRRDYFVFHFIPFQPLHLLHILSLLGLN